MPSGARRVTREDTYRLDKAERLPNGSIRVDAIATTSGVFVYHDDAGKEIREWRPPSEVEKADSVKSLKDATVTVLHPPGLVTPENWSTYAAGHVSGEPRVTSDGVRASLVISRGDAIKDVSTDKLKECSCGYSLWVEESSGTTPTGERYDAIQRDIVYNHIAIGPSGWGRQGANVSLRLDSAGNQVSHTGEQNIMKITIVLDGKTYTVDAGSQEHTDLLNKAAAQKAEYDALVAAKKELQGKLDAKTGEADTLVKQVAEQKVKLDAAPALAREAATARLKLEGQAVTILGADFKCDGKDDNAVRVEIIKKFDPDFKYDAKEHSADYVRGRSETHMKAGTLDVQERIALDASGVKTTKQDSAKEYVLDSNAPDVEGARKNMYTNNAKASKGFAFSR